MDYQPADNTPTRDEIIAKYADLDRDGVPVFWRSIDWYECQNELRRFGYPDLDEA